MAAYYPPAGFHFRVEFEFLSGDTQDIHFQEVSGLAAEITTEELVEGGENRFNHRLPTRAKYANLVLKRGLLTDSKLIDWITHAVENLEANPGVAGQEPTSVYVTLLNEEQKPVADTYSFVRAWPVKWSVSDFKAMDNSLVIETLELSYQYFTKKKLQ
ncbi:phage tail protein [Thalassomonas viridans]|uniref:Phage tail protein n=1 Tax=Thalassomonas viridans TaxID=137584 RepID=A0AAE9YXA1_9GAMM|nr:phage tail protein [Thalassomonas viridans]WDE02901.1 phage tail protein [Thalassomonas viridans]